MKKQLALTVLATLILLSSAKFDLDETMGKIRSHVKSTIDKVKETKIHEDAYKKIKEAAGTVQNHPVTTKVVDQIHSVTDKVVGPVAKEVKIVPVKKTEQPTTDLTPKVEHPTTDLTPVRPKVVKVDPRPQAVTVIEIKV